VSKTGAVIGQFVKTQTLAAAITMLQADRHAPFIVTVEALMRDIESIRTTIEVRPKVRLWIIHFAAKPLWRCRRCPGRQRCERGSKSGEGKEIFHPDNVIEFTLIIKSKLFYEFIIKTQCPSPSSSFAPFVQSPNWGPSVPLPSG
jgi:hypothetical protein